MAECLHCRVLRTIAAWSVENGRVEGQGVISATPDQLFPPLVQVIADLARMMPSSERKALAANLHQMLGVALAEAPPPAIVPVTGNATSH